MPESLEKQAREIQAISKRLGLDYRQLAEAIALKPESMRKIMNGYQKASDSVMLSIRRVESMRNDPALVALRELGPESELFKLVPRRKVAVVSWARAGLIHEHGLNYEDAAGQIQEEVETDSKDPNAFGLIIEGDSMEPMYLAGDRVVFAPNEEPRNGDIVVARLRESGQTLFKKFRRTGSDGMIVKLESVNRRYKTVQFKIDEFRFIYPAVDMIRKIRR